jgi:hypothetical protein
LGDELLDVFDAYLRYYNHKRRHRGRWNKGATPASIIIPNPKMKP